MRLHTLDFEALSREHLTLLFQWLNTSHVAEQWDGALSIEEVSGLNRFSQRFSIASAPNILNRFGR